MTQTMHHFPLAAIILDTVGLVSAMLDNDLDEVRFRSCLIATFALCRDFPEIAHAASNLVDYLGPPGTLPDARYAEAVTELSLRIEVAASR